MGCSASLTFSGGRLILETARDGLLPYGHTIGYVNPQFKSPINAMVLQYVLVVIYLVATPGAVYQFIIAFASWPAYIFFLLIGIGVLILRQREPTLTRPYKACYSKSKLRMKSMNDSWNQMLWQQVLLLSLSSSRFTKYCLFSCPCIVRITHIGVRTAFLLMWLSAISIQWELMWKL